MKAEKPQLVELERRCRELGAPVTAQRRAVLEVLLSREDHPTADDIARVLPARLAGMSRATVYRTLETLVRLGLVVRASHPGAATRFDIRTERHHHLVCESCGRIIDLELPAVGELDLTHVVASGFDVRDYSVYVQGTCAACRASSNAS